MGSSRRLVLHPRHGIHRWLRLQVDRDLKPDNIIIGKNGRTYLCDFGMSCHKSNDCQVAHGTPFFMAPEQAACNEDSWILSDEFKKYDEKVDIWAFGIVAVYLAVGFAPWSDFVKKCNGFGVNNRLLAHISRHNVPDVLEKSGFSWNYQTMVKQCLERKPADRPTARQLTCCPGLQCNSQDMDEFSEFMAELLPNVES